MEQLNSGVLNTDNIAELGTASDAGAESPTDQNTQTDDTQADNFTVVEESEAQTEQPEKEAKPQSESGPDAELLNALKDPNIPIGKIKRFQELIKQRNELRQQLEQKSNVPEKTDGGSNQREANQSLDISKYSNDVREMRKQLPDIEVPQLFEYEVDETGALAYKDPSKQPKTFEDAIKVMYPVIEENILARMGMMGEIRQKQADSAKQAEESGTKALKQEIMESFDDDNDYKEYARILEEDLKEFRDLHPNTVMDIRGHLFNYIKHTYKKAPEVERQNLATAQKVGTSTTRTPKKGISTSDFDIDDIANM